MVSSSRMGNRELQQLGCAPLASPLVVLDHPPPTTFVTSAPAANQIAAFTTVWAIMSSIIIGVPSFTPAKNCVINRCAGQATSTTHPQRTSRSDELPIPPLTISAPLATN